MPELHFAKMHGLGNDFVIAGPEESAAVFGSDMVRRLADRRTGVGFDQLLLITAPHEDEASAHGLKIWNSDGGEVAQCGNGARAAFEYLKQAGKCGKQCNFRTAAGSISVCAGKTGPRATLGIPEFEPKLIPLTAVRRADSYEISWNGRPMRYFALSLGNPHAVFVCSDDENPPVRELGEWLNSSRSVFPQGVNASFVWKLSDDLIKVRVFERGAGETPSCGSAAAAVSVAMWLLHEQTEQTIEFEYGSLRAGWGGDRSGAWVEGAVKHVYNGSTELGNFDYLPKKHNC